MSRLGATIAGLCLAVAASTTASAEVFHDASSQQTFGFDAVGDPGAIESADPEFVEAWQKFAATTEGARILDRLNRQVGYVITIKTASQEEIPYDKGVYGLTERVKTPDSSPGEITVWIRNHGTGGVDNLADTIYHELRHVEFFFDEDDDGHDHLHAETDDGYVAFVEQLAAVDLDAENASSTGGSDGQPPLIDNTPIWDHLEDERKDETRLGFIAQDLGQLFDLSQTQAPTLTAPEGDVLGAGVIGEIDADTLHVIDDLIENFEGPSGEAPPDAAGGCGPSGGATLCIPDEGPAVTEGDVLLGIELGAPVPAPGSVFDSNLNFFVAFDSDGDPANNVPAVEGFENWPFRGTDRWWRVYRASATGDFRFFSQGTDGDPNDLSLPTDAAAIVEDDTLFFVVPRSELPAEFPLFRLGVIQYQNDLDTGPRGIDVLGELGTDPLWSLDGSFLFNDPSSVVPTVNGFNAYFGPTVVPSGGILETGTCLYGLDGGPIVGQEVATTLGAEPGGPLASHAEAITDDMGCFTAPLPVNEPPGSSILWVFDGQDVAGVETIILIEPTLAPDDS